MKKVRFLGGGGGRGGGSGKAVGGITGYWRDAICRWAIMAIKCLKPSKSWVWKRTSWEGNGNGLYFVTSFFVDIVGEVRGGSPVLGAGTHYM